MFPELAQCVNQVSGRARMPIGCQRMRYWEIGPKRLCLLVFGCVNWTWESVFVPVCSRVLTCVYQLDPATARLFLVRTAGPHGNALNPPRAVCSLRLRLCCCVSSAVTEHHRASAGSSTVATRPNRALTPGMDSPVPRTWCHFGVGAACICSHFCPRVRQTTFAAALSGGVTDVLL